MATLRLAAWNVAWFARLFDRRDRLVADGAESAVPGVSRRRQAEAIATVLARLDADLLAVIEAPNTGRTQSAVKALETFAAAHDLRQRAALAGFESPTHQEIALLFDPGRIAAEHAPIGEPTSAATTRAGRSPLAAPRFDSVFADTGTVWRFSKPPLEAAIEDRATGLAFRLIAVHLKSRAPGVEGQAEARARRMVRNRALQRAQAAWIRARVDEHLAAGEPLAVLGDFNDSPAGPGEDRSSVEVVAGDPDRPARMLVNPWLAGELPCAVTARFAAGGGGAPGMARDEARGEARNEARGEARDEARGEASREASGEARVGAPADAGERRAAGAMVDFILLSRALAPTDRQSWRIWHPEADARCRADPALAAALRDASDHFPVSVDLPPLPRAAGGPDGPPAESE